MKAKTKKKLYQRKKTNTLNPLVQFSTNEEQREIGLVTATVEVVF